MEISQQIIRSLGMTLVHSIWQGAIIAALILFLLALGKKSNARYRYGVLLSGLILMLAGFITTFIVVLPGNQLPESLQVTLSQVQIQQILKDNVTVNPVSLAARILSYLEPFYPVIAIGWIAGFIIMSLKILGGSFYGRISLRRNLITPEVQLQEIFDSLKESMNLPSVRFFVSRRMISPLVTGVFRPMVIIPLAAVTGLSTGQIRAIMVHELAHIRRYDNIVIIVQAIAQQVLFFHPLAWFLIPEIDRERENCCDDFVIRSQNNPINYIKALTMIQEMNLQGIPANNLAGKRSKHLLGRISRLIKPEIRHSAAFRLMTISILVATIGISCMALIVSDHYNVKNSPDGLSTAFQPDTTKKQKQNVTVNNNKRPSKAKNAEVIRQLQEELQASQQQLNEANQKLMEAERQLEIAHQNMIAVQPPNPEMFSFNFDKKTFEDMPEFHFNPEEFNQLNNKEFRDEMQKAQEEAKKAMEEAWKNNKFDNEESRQQMKKFQEQQEQYWKKHQDEWKIQAEKFREQAEKQKEYWEEHKGEWEQQMKRAKEEASKAFEEMKKSGNLHSNPMDIEMDIDIDTDIVAPVPPELPESPEVVAPVEDIRDQPADTGKSDIRNLDNKLRELEKE